MSETELNNTRLTLLVLGCSVTWLAGVMQIAGVGYQMPQIGRDFGVEQVAEQTWVMTGFNIVWGSFALVSGRISDIYGLRRSFMFGVGWTSIFMLVSACMPNIIAFSAARAVAALGFAMACPSMTGIVGRYVPRGKKRTIAFAVVAGSGSVGACIGWSGGGYLSAVKYGFRIFAGIVAALLVIPFLTGWLLVPKDTPHPTDKTVDWTGGALFTVADLCVMLAMTLGVDYGWSEPYVGTLFGLSALTAVLFVYRQYDLNRSQKSVPLVPARLVVGKGKSRLIALYFATILTWCGQDSTFVMAAYYYSEVLKLSVKEAATRVLPATASGIILSFIIAAVITWFSDGVLLLITNVLNALGPMLLAISKPGAPYWKYDLWAWLFMGHATEGMQAVGQILISHTTAPEDQAAGMAILLGLQRFGAAFGLTISTTIRASVTEAYLKNTARTESDQVRGDEKGIKGGLWFCAAALIAATCGDWTLAGRWLFARAALTYTAGVICLVGVRGGWGAGKYDDVVQPIATDSEHQTIAQIGDEQKNQSDAEGGVKGDGDAGADRELKNTTGVLDDAQQARQVPVLV